LKFFKVPLEMKVSFHKKSNRSHLAFILALALALYLSVTVVNGDLNEGNAARFPPNVFTTGTELILPSNHVPSQSSFPSFLHVPFFTSFFIYPRYVLQQAHNALIQIPML
jgi:hypothetical protein